MIRIIEEINNFNKIIGSSIKALAKFYTYDKRKRLNYQQKLDNVASCSCNDYTFIPRQ